MSIVVTALPECDKFQYELIVEFVLTSYTNKIYVKYINNLLFANFIVFIRFALINCDNNIFEICIELFRNVKVWHILNGGHIPVPDYNCNINI